MFNGVPDNEVIDIDTYCPKCGGTGITPFGEVCTCPNAHHAFGVGVSCLDVPKQYAGRHFNSKLVPSDCGPTYGSYLQKFHDNIIAMKYVNYNCLICSPIAHSKTVLAYSVLESLFRKNIPTFPVCTILELRRILRDMDAGVTGDYGFSTPVSNLMSAPYIFVKIPMILSWEVYPTMVDILDRRVRRNLSTIFIFDGYIDDLEKFDKSNILRSIKGNGTFHTIDVHNFYKISHDSDIQKFNDMLKEFQA